MERKISGYIQSKNTAQGWQKMKRRGAILPPFRIQDNVTRLISNEYDMWIADIDKAFTTQSMHTGESISDANYGKKLHTFIITILNTFSKRIRRDKFREALGRQFEDSKDEFFKSLLEDSPRKLELSISFALQSDQVFKNKIDLIKQFYVNDAIDRIDQGGSTLRKIFINQMGGWIEGNNDLSGLSDVIENIKQESGKFSQFFARDQMARLNKSLQLASFDKAGAKKLRWWTVKDGRVRPSHKALHNKVFDIDKLPEEAKSYNCRCSFLPVFED